MNKLIIALSILINSWSLTTNGQNLVEDGSFEEVVNWQTEIRPLSLRYWKEGRSNYFYMNLRANSNREPQYNVPQNAFGSQQPRTGDGYVLLWQVFTIPATSRSYIQTKLKKPLKKGWKYKVEFYVSLADNSNVAINQLGAYFSPAVITDQVSPILLLQPQVANLPERFLEDKLNWTLISGEFIAEGGESYLTIGNFSDQKSTQYTSKIRHLQHPLARYYLDDVSVTIVDSIVTLPLQKGQAFLLDNLLFVPGTSHLLKSFSAELDQLAEKLKLSPELTIEIEGHTDSTGSTKSNLKLSQDRAATIRQYLTANGISPSRITCKGYGSTRPIADNATEEGRKKNRRVEIIIK